MENRERKSIRKLSVLFHRNHQDDDSCDDGNDDLDQNISFVNERLVSNPTSARSVGKLLSYLSVHFCRHPRLM